MLLGGWNFSDVKEAGSLPQKAASAIVALNGLVGTNYAPVAYVGQQLVNGINYAFVCKQTLVTANPEDHIVLVVIHESTDGKYGITSIERLL